MKVRSWGLPAVLIVGFLIRLAFIRVQGFTNDVASFEAWAIALVAHGPRGFYASTNFLDYPPGYFYILGLIGWIWAGFFGNHDPGYTILAALVKLPAIIADLGIGALLYALARRFTSQVVALGVAALYVLNPAVIFVSALWGQVDSVAAFFALFAIYALLRSDDVTLPNRATAWIVGGWAAFAYSLLVKPQAAVLLPLAIAFAFTNRERRDLRLRATAYGIVAATILVIVLVEPFHPSNPIGAIAWLLERLSYGTNIYPYNSVNAFNLWAIRGKLWQYDNQYVGFLMQATWGILLVLVALALVVWRYVQAKTPQALLEGSAVALLAFFTLATRMHERYVFDGVLFTVACVPIARRYLWCAVLLSIVFFANLNYSWQYIALIASPRPGIDASNLWGALTVFFAAANVATFFFLGWFYLGGAEEERGIEPGTEPPTLSERLGSLFPHRVRAWFDPREGLATLRKPLDYLVMTGLGLISFLLSLVVPKWYWKPTDKIFDEVYFARAAEEYLKNHRIYEDTHPPLSKLLITFSTMLFGGMPKGHGLGGWTFFNALAHLSNGDNSHGWRFLDVLFGALVVMLLYAFAKRVTGSTVFSAIAAALLILDGMHYVQSRIATPEGFVIFFSLAAVYAFYRFWIASQVEQRPHVVVPSWGYAAGALGSLVCGLVAAELFNLAQEALFKWPSLAVTVFSITRFHFSVPITPLLVVTLYFACGFYLLARYVVMPSFFGDGLRETTFPDGSYALQGSSGSEMHTPDGGVIGGAAKSIRRGEMTKSKGGALVYDDDDVEITYRRDSIAYETTAGTATYADSHIESGGAVENTRSAKLWLLLFTLALGALVSTKWYGVMGFGVSFLVIILVWLQRYIFTRRPALWGNPRGFRLDGALITIVFVSMTVYGLVWLPDLIRQAPDPNEIHNINDVVQRQYGMFEYHYNLRATHPYSSKWFEWPFDYVPVAYYYKDDRTNTNDPNACCIHEITSMPNPFDLWFGLLSVPIVGILAWRERSKAYALIVITYLLQWLPWMFSPRLAWEYHFYVDIPLIALSNAIVLQRIWRWASAGDRRRRLIGGIAICTVLGVITASFLFFFPILSAWPITWNAWNARMWLHTWIIGPG